jgi:ubiquinone/menaquinone biosynthesis C-methylase UbiE
MIDGQKLTNWYDFQAPFYHLWRDDYDGPLVRAVAGRLQTMGERLRVLDAGCGTGFFGIGLARRGHGWRIEGLDASAGMIRVARRQADRHGLSGATFRQGDVTALPYDDGSFDAVVAAGLMPNLNDWSAALAELRRVLRPVGRLFVIEFDRTTLRGGRRLVFRAMILGYRAVSAVFRRFRFAEGWSVEASTVDRARLERLLGEAGFRRERLDREQAHLIYELTRTSDPAPQRGLGG